MLVCAVLCQRHRTVSTALYGTTPYRCVLPSQVPLCYPFVEAFRLAMLAMSHPHFPFNVLGAVLARNTSRMLRDIQIDEKLTYM